MSQPMLLARIKQIEAQLGQPFPADYRAFLLDDANKDTMVWKIFANPKSYVCNEADWTQDFPFSLEHPVDDSPLREFLKRAVHAYKVENDIDKYDAIDEEASDYMEENIAKPMEQGIIYIADEGCGMFSFLVLRGEAVGQVWWCELDSFSATIQPHTHPFTHEPLSFTEWRFFDKYCYRLTAKHENLPDSQARSWTYPLDSREGRNAMMSMLAEEKLTGMTSEAIEKVTCIDDIPEDAMFFDTFMNEWHPVRNGIVFQISTM